MELNQLFNQRMASLFLNETDNMFYVRYLLQNELMGSSKGAGKNLSKLKTYQFLTPAYADCRKPGESFSKIDKGFLH